MKAMIAFCFRKHGPRFAALACACAVALAPWVVFWPVSLGADLGGYQAYAGSEVGQGLASSQLL